MIEEVISSKIIYEGKIIKVKLDEVKLPNSYVTTREIIEYPNAVALIPINNNGKLIMINQYRHSAQEVLLEIPAGTMEKNETPEECAKRELLEETGYEAKELKKLFSCYLAPGYSTEFIHIFLAKNLTYKGQKMEVDEQIKVVELSFEEALEKIRKGEIKDAKTISSLLFFFTFKMKL
ncbi:MAG: NUDIX hydrolase [Candidatus Bathyarchaeia archaeon]|nr:NUDIX hydrolase [Candidatus Bathyarchaeota archaeon]